MYILWCVITFLYLIMLRHVRYGAYNFENITLNQNTIITVAFHIAFKLIVFWLIKSYCAITTFPQAMYNSIYMYIDFYLKCCKMYVHDSIDIVCFDNLQVSRESI